MRRLRASGLLLTLACLAASARADAISAPDCPAGSRAETRGHGIVCAPLDCTTAPCEAGLECREVALCLETFDGEPSVVVGACEEPGACLESDGRRPLGVTGCSRRLRCVPVPAAPAPPYEPGWLACSAGPRRSGPAGLVAALAVVLRARASRFRARRRGRGGGPRPDPSSSPRRPSRTS